MSTTVETLAVDTSIFPVVWRHLDDDTACEHPEVCRRDTYVRGGRPNFGECPTDQGNR